MPEVSKSNKRIYYYDFLRILATFAVIMIHITSQNWDKSILSDFQWQIYNLFNSASRWCLPVFVMISGALFLNSSYGIKRILRKNVFRLVTAFIFWTVIYAILDYLNGIRLKVVLRGLICGHYHMWFIFMIIGLYIAIPIIRTIINNEKIMKYFLTLGFAFSIAIPQIVLFTTAVSPKIGNILKDANTNFNFSIAAGYAFYFVLGYYLSKAEISAKTRKKIYVLGLLSFVVSSVIYSVFICTKTSIFMPALHGYFNIDVFIEAVSLFIFFKYNINDLESRPKLRVLVEKMSLYSFGVYLVHPLILELTDKFFNINSKALNPLLEVSVVFLGVCLVSFVISGILNLIPKLNKYIV